MSSVSIKGFVINNVESNPNSEIYKKLIEDGLKIAEKAFEGLPEGAAMKIAFPGYECGFAYVNTVAGAVPFACNKVGDEWKLSYIMDAKNIPTSTETIEARFLSFIKSITKENALNVTKSDPAFSKAYNDFVREFGTYLFLYKNAPHEYNEENVLNSAKALKILTEYNEARSESVPTTYNHSVRVACLAVEIGKKLNCTDNELEILKNAALLHDIGKTKVSRDILTKRGSLTDEERISINAHGKATGNILRTIFSNIPELVVRVAENHHNGLKTPQMTKAEISERELKLHDIICCADVAEAMLSTERTYKNGSNIDYAMGVVEKNVKNGKISLEVSKAANAVLVEMEQMLAFDRNANLDFSGINPELQGLIEDNSTIAKIYSPELDNVMEDLLKRAAWIDRNIPPILEEVVAFEKDALTTLSKYTWKEIYDCEYFKEISKHETSAENVVKNLILYIRNREITGLLDTKDTEIFKQKADSIKRDSARNIIDLHKRITEAIETARKNNALKGVTWQSEKMDVAK